MPSSAIIKSLFFFPVLVLLACGGSTGGGRKAGVPIPASPFGVTATPASAQVTPAWTAVSGATTYNVKRGTVTGGPYTTVSSPSAASFNDTGLTNFITYYYVISAVNSAGESANSAQIYVMPITITAAPTGLTATSGNAQVSLAWTAVTAAATYKVKRGPETGRPSTAIGSPSAASFNDTTA